MFIYTVSGNKIEVGAVVEQIEMPTYSVTAIQIGEDGRGRKRGFLVCAFKPGHITQACLTKTNSGAWKLASYGIDKEDHCIVVFKTPMGMSGSNDYRGDEILVKELDMFGKQKTAFRPFPGKYVSKGMVADGVAGSCSSGGQFVCLVKYGEIVRVEVNGRHNDNDDIRYFIFTKGGVQMVTKKERLEGLNEAFSGFKEYETEQEALDDGCVPYLMAAQPELYEN